MWVYKKKGGLGNEGTKYKARLVAKGYNQVEEVGFHEMFSLVVKHTSIWVLLAVVAIHGLELEQLDVKIAILRSDPDEDIYIQKL